MPKFATVVMFLIFSLLPAAWGGPTRQSPIGGAAGVGLGGRLVTFGVVINEVAIGPAFSYVELSNTGAASVDLDGYVLETSQGSFVLSFPANLGPHEFALISAGPAIQVGVSDDPEVLAMIVGNTIVAGDVDTVILRDAMGQVIDAVTYGLQRDASARYGAALQAGQFVDEQFLDISGLFGEVVIGRSSTGLDSNDMLDWAPSGGANALTGSPLGANNALPFGEDFSVTWFQQRFNEFALGSYYNFDVLTASYSAYSGTSANSHAVHHFTVSSPDVGSSVTLSGVVNFAFTPDRNGS